MAWNYPTAAEKGSPIEIEATDRKYLHKVKEGVASAMGRRDTSGIHYNIKQMKLGVFKGMGQGWIIHNLILKQDDKNTIGDR